MDVVCGVFGEWWSVGDRSVMRLKCANFLKIFLWIFQKRMGTAEAVPIQAPEPPARVS
jgi:hypothetical protein